MEMLVPGMLVLGMLMPGMPRQGGHTLASDFPPRAGRQELGRNRLCSRRMLQEEELQSLSL